MKGLLIKDTRLLLVQKKLLILYFFVSIMLSYAMDSGFIVSYFPMIGMMLILSTIAYDTHDNGMSFLMTMPVRPGDYAVAKYIFSVIGLFCTWALAVVMQFASFFIRHTPFNASEVMIEDFMILPLFFVMISIMIPVEFKYTPEKGRIVMFVICGVFILIAIAGKGILDSVSGTFGIDFEALASKADTLSPITVIVALYAACVVILTISLICSIRIMQKKEF